jgi:hypothetical protein
MCVPELGKFSDRVERFMNRFRCHVIFGHR